MAIITMRRGTELIPRFRLFISGLLVSAEAPVISAELGSVPDAVHSFMAPGIHQLHCGCVNEWQDVFDVNKCEDCCELCDGN